MNAAPRPRKPIDELSPDDLYAFPIWRFLTDDGDESLADDEDETWVTPLDLDHVPANAYALSVAATFTTPQGRELSGIVQVDTTPGTVEVGHAALLVDGEYLFLPGVDYRDADSDYERAASALGLTHDALFPLAYRLAVPVGNGTERFTGTFHG